MTTDPNWSQVGPFIPIESLATSFAGPVVLADETQTITWFVGNGKNRGPRQHKFNVQNNEGHFLQHEDGKKAGEPVTDTVTVTPAFWALAKVID